MSDVLDFYSSDAIKRRLERLLNQPAPTPKPAPKPAPDPADGPRDCVRQFPAIGEMSVELVAFDFDGIPRLAIRFGRDVPLGEWEAWMVRWTRRRYGQRILAVVD